MEPTQNWEEANPDDLVLPDRYFIDPERKLCHRRLTSSGKEKTVVIALAPTWIVARMRDIETNDETWTLRCDRPNEPGDPTRRIIISRAEGQNPRELAKVAGKGLLINAKNANDIIEFLVAWEVANAHLLPLLVVTSVPGWQVDGTFVVGNRHLTSDGPGILRLVSTSDGETQIIAGYQTLGTLKAWRDAVARVVPYPRVVIVILSCLAAPLLQVLDAPNFMVNLSAATSTGKTTAERIGASVWGNPDERADGSLIRTWNMTKVGAERIAALCNGLPMILDDTRSADPEIVEKIIYLLCGGIGKTRGSLKGLAHTGKFHTIGVSSGEQTLRSFFASKGGAVMRTLEIEGAPFGERSAATEPEVKAINAAILENYGHAGPALIEWLIGGTEDERTARWSELRKHYKEAQAYYRSLAGDDGPRLADYAAVLDVAAYAARIALELEWLSEHPVEVLWEAATEAAQDTDDAESALALVFSWARGHEMQFRGRSGPAEFLRGDGWAGRWDLVWTELHFLPHKLVKVLEEYGYDKGMISRWKNLGWLKHEKDRDQNSVRVEKGKRPERVYSIKRETLEKLKLCDPESIGTDTTGDAAANSANQPLIADEPEL